MEQFKMMKRTTEILRFIEPIRKYDFSNVEELKENLKETNTKLTLLPLDFFYSIINLFETNSVISRGDWVNVGVWKGGASLFFNSLMKDLKVSKKLVLVDTFSNFPVKEITKEKDVSFVSEFSMKEQLPVGYLDSVKKLFTEYNLIDNVHFEAVDILDNTINELKVDKISFLFIDVDFYEPTYKALELFYDNVVQNGIIIIDDYFMSLVNCKEAVDDFFNKKNIDLRKISSKFSTYSLLINKP